MKNIASDLIAWNVRFQYLLPSVYLPGSAIMASTLPISSKQWNVAGVEGVKSLKYSIQPISELGDNEVLVASASP